MIDSGDISIVMFKIMDRYQLFISYCL